MKIFDGALVNVLHSDHDVFELDEELLVRHENILTTSGGASSAAVHSKTGRIVAYERMHCRLFGNLLYLIRLDGQQSQTLLDRTLVLLVKNASAKIVPISKSLEFILELPSSSARYYFLCQTIVQRDSWLQKLDGNVYKNLRQNNILESKNILPTYKPSESNEYYSDLNKNALFTFDCDNLCQIISAILPFVWLVVCFRKVNPQSSDNWIELGCTEAIRSRSPRFTTGIHVPFYDDVEYKFELFHSFQSVFYAPKLFVSLIVSKGSIRRYNRFLLGEPFQYSSLNLTLHSTPNVCHKMNSHIPSIIHQHYFPHCPSLQNLVFSEELKHLPGIFSRSIELLSKYMNENLCLLTLLSELTFLQKFPLDGSVLDIHHSLIEYLEEQKSQLEVHSKKNKVFRESSTKEVPFLQSVPINFHEYTTQTPNLTAKTFTGGAIAFHQNLSHSPSSQLLKMLSIYNHLIFVIKTRQFINTFTTEHQLTIECVPHEHPLYSQSLKIEGITAFYESTAEFCQQIVQDQMQPSLVNHAFNIIQQNLSARGYESSFEDQYEPIDLTYLNVRACCVKIQEVVFAKKESLQYCDVVSVNSKLLSALTSLEKALLTIYSSLTFMNINKNDYVVLLYREYCLQIQILQHLLFFGWNCSLETIEQLSRTNHFPIVYETLLTSGGLERRMLSEIIQSIEWLERNVHLQFVPNLEEAHIQSIGPKYLVNVPKMFEIDLIDFDRPAKYRPIVFLFNMGVNSEEHIAHLKNETSLQFDNNERMFLKLFKFKENYYMNNSLLNDLISELEVKIKNRTRKDVDFLVIMKDIRELIGAIGVTCCKSGKDRTSMSVTWEHTRRQLKANNITDKLSEETIIYSLRKNGVRIKNVIMNIGLNKYAFNPLQRVFLPKILQPPLECCLYGTRDQFT